MNRKSPATNRSQSLAALAMTLALMLGCWSGCASDPMLTGHPKLVDPEKTTRESGGTDDIYEATERAIASMSQSRRLQSLESRRIVLGKIVNNTGIPGYDERIIYNRFLSDLVNRAGDSYVFLNRGTVDAERRAQLSGEVSTSGIDALPAGANLVLDLELRALQGRRTETVQYSFSLTDLSGVLVWTDAFDIRKRS